MKLPCPVSIYTLGCKLNQLESEAVADSFSKAGFPLIPWGGVMEGPGILIVNTCTVTSKADQKARRVIRKALRDNPGACVIATGCYALLDPGEIESLEADAAANSLDDAPPGQRRLFLTGGEGSGAGAAKGALLDLPGRLLKAMGESPASFPAVLEKCLRGGRGDSPFNFKPDEFVFHSRGYLKIQDGCDNSCAYCRVRLARGPSASLRKEDALARLLSFEAAGCAELMITGINITQYSHSGLDLAGLLEYLLENSKSIALRLSSLEPEGISGRLTAALAHPRIRPHFHLSVQSGSDAVLAKMGRVYDSAAVENAAGLLRSVKGDPFLACDIIAGFPGETENEFSRTFSLCEKIQFAWIHAFHYSPRPGTRAWSFEGRVPEPEAARRVQALTALALKGRRDYARNWLGRELSAIVEKGKKTTAGQCPAVSENYLKLIVSYSGEAPQPGTVIRCVPVTLSEPLQCRAV